VTPPVNPLGSYDALESTRAPFLRDDNHYGCAETALVALQEIYRFADASDSSSAMVLNVSRSGSITGQLPMESSRLR